MHYNSYNEISMVIDSIASAIQDVVKSSNSILTQVNETNEDMEKTGEIIKQIAEKI